MLRAQRSALRCPGLYQGRITDVERAFTITNSVQFYTSHFCIDQLGDPVTVRSSYTILLCVNNSTLAWWLNNW